MSRKQSHPKPGTNPPGLAARRAAFDLVRAVTAERRRLDDAIADIDPALPTADRALAVFIAKTAVRRAGEIDALLEHCLDQPPAAKARDVLNVLRVGIAQLFYSNVAPHAAVSTSVDLCRDAGLEHMAKLVNAVLRRLSREGKPLLAGLDGPRINTPDWLWQSWAATYGADTARAIATMHLEAPPLDLSAAGEPAQLALAVGGQVMPGGAVRLANTENVSELAGFADGGWWVQDMAARLPANLLGPGEGRQVADLCAAPGGKTMQLAAAGWQVTAVDISARRMARLAENLTRTGLAAEVVVADVADWRPAQRFDAVLLDAPCSATGTLRRHPDVARLKNPADVGKLTGVQARLLAAAANLVAEGGTLVYSVCSLEPEEGSDVITGFLNARPEFRRDSVAVTDLPGLELAITPAGDLRTLPSYLAQQGGMDGFFAARLTRQN